MSPKRCALPLALLISVAATPQIGQAEQVSLLREATFLTDRRALIQVKQPTLDAGTPRNVASLFTGQQGTSFFAPYPARRARTEDRVHFDPNTTQVERIRQLIGHAEAGQQGYDAIQHRATQLPGKRPTEMSIAEIYDWIGKTPGQQHAIGRYQFIPSTLRRLVAELGVDQREVFSPRLQDQLANALLAEAGLIDFSRGELERHQFMNNMAKIWAGLPASTGQSYYHDFAGNRATMTWAHFDTEMAKIFPG